MVTENMKQALANEIEEAMECYDNPPPNEASTCDWIILPLLKAVEYSKKDIYSQIGNAGNQYPDYTILPNTPDTWYLEAKDWNNSLDKNLEAAIQALNYANAHGHRWVVLSSGKVWMLFDNHIQGMPVDKRVARTEICEPGFTDFMLALSKNSVQTGGLAEYAATWRLREVMRQQLVRKDSDVVKAIQRVLKNKIGLSAIQSSDIVRYFGEVLEVATDIPKPEEMTSSNPLPGDIKSLAELLEMGDELFSSRPSEVLLPDNTRVEVKTWADTGSAVVTWIGNTYGLLILPFRGSKNAKTRWFLNTSPIHSDGKSMVYRQLQLGNLNIYMNVNLSSSSFILALSNLCDASNVAKTDIKVRLTTKYN